MIWQVRRTEIFLTPVSSWALHGATKNLALQMGLHREPSLFKIPEPEAEIRRRVWWCIYIQDRFDSPNGDNLW